MKSHRFLSTLYLVLTLTILSCRSTSDEPNAETNGNLQLKFENGFNNLGNVVLNQTTQTSLNGQKHQFSTLKYIISNITLIDDSGKEFRYHYNDPDQGAFIISQNEAKAGIVFIDLKDIPAGRYRQIKYGLGISQSAYLLGQDGQGIFWEKAKKEGMTWSWAAGYIFSKLEGRYGNAAADTEFMNHCGNVGNAEANGTPDLYREITLTLPTTARISANITPSIHITADLNQFLSGAHQLILNRNTDMAMGSGSASEPHLIQVTDNLSAMFKVDHVHND